MVSVERLNYLISEEDNHILSRHSLQHKLSQEDDSLLISIFPNDSFIGIDRITYHYKKQESTNLLNDSFKENLIDRLLNYKNLFSLDKFEFSEQNDNNEGDFNNITQIQRFVDFFEFGLSNLLVLNDLNSLDLQLNQNSLEASVPRVRSLLSNSSIINKKLALNSLNFIRYFSRFFEWRDNPDDNTHCEVIQFKQTDELSENLFELKDEQTKLVETQNLLIKRISQLESSVCENDQNNTEVEIGQVITELDRLLHEMNELELRIKSNEEKISKLLLHHESVEIYINDRVDEVNSRINDVINEMNDTDEEIENDDEVETRIEKPKPQYHTHVNKAHVKLIPRTLKDKMKDYNEVKKNVVSNDINCRNRIDKLTSIVNDHIERSNERFTRIENLFDKIFVIVSSLAKKRVS
jgi:hypothetical protein